MPAPVRDHRPLWVRVASRTAALFGVRFYNMLYGERTLGDAMQLVEPLPGLIVRRATPLDLARLGRVFGPAQAESCRIATAQHSKCFVAVEGEEIAGYSWLNTHDIYLLSWKVQALPPQGGYTYNSFVRPEFRGQKIFQRLTEAVYSELEQEGFQFCCNLVDRQCTFGRGTKAPGRPVPRRTHSQGSGPEPTPTAEIPIRSIDCRFTG